MVYAEFYHGLRFIASNHGKILRIPWFGGCYSYSNMTKQLKYLLLTLYLTKIHIHLTNVQNTSGCSTTCTLWQVAFSH